VKAKEGEGEARTGRGGDLGVKKAKEGMGERKEDQDRKKEQMDEGCGSTNMAQE
jgi:hypothetical protein